jgi:hypothetical protein
VIGDYIEGICSLGIGPMAEWKGWEYNLNVLVITGAFAAVWSNSSLRQVDVKLNRSPKFII